MEMFTKDDLISLASGASGATMPKARGPSERLQTLLQLDSNSSSNSSNMAEGAPQSRSSSSRMSTDILTNFLNQQIPAHRRAEKLANTPSLGLTASNLAKSNLGQESKDIFADLTGLMLSKPWNAKPSSKPTLTQNSIVNVPNGRLRDNVPPSTATPVVPNTPPVRVQSVEQPRDEHPPGIHFQPIIRLPSNSNYADTTDTSGSTTLAGQEYDKQDTIRMENMMAEMEGLNATPSSEPEAPAELDISPGCQHGEAPAQSLIELDALESLPTDNDGITVEPVAPVFGTADEPIVRCTMVVWDNMMTQLSNLKKEKLDAEAEVAALRRRMTQRAVDPQKTPPDFGEFQRELNKLQNRLDLNRDYKAAMSRDIRQKDIELQKKELEIEELEKKVADYEAMRERLEASRNEAEYLRSHGIEDKEESAAKLAQVIASRDQEISELKEAAARSEAKMFDHKTRADNLVDTQKTREKMLRETERKLAALEDAKIKLLDELDDLKQHVRPLDTRIQNLEAQLREKVSTADRIRNDLRHTQKRLELALKSLLKIENGDHLRGAAHLIVPGSDTKLPKLVFPCMECYVKNLDCDASATCLNCSASGDKCARWRCSTRHIQLECNEVPCRFHHDRAGWLMSQTPRTQW